MLRYRGAASGVDLSDAEICELAEHPNCFGVKASPRAFSADMQLTCGNIGKGTRIALYTSSPEFLKRKGEALKKFTVTGQFQVSGAISVHCLLTYVDRTWVR